MEILVFFLKGVSKNTSQSVQIYLPSEQIDVSYELN